ncbi:MAG: PleD family two-component system response regulator [Anaplasma sp.]
MTARILVVDDLIANVKLLQAKLTKEYYNVLTAMSGEEAIKTAKEKQPDLILLDVMMPDMDGYETCKRLREDPATTYIPIVMVTALDNTTDNRVSGISSGADDFLTKPINDVALFSRIRSLTRFKILVDELRLRGKTNTEMSAVDGGIMHYANQISDGRIMIIDSDKIRSEHLNGVLQEHFLETVVVDNPSQVVNLHNAEGYDLFIIDLNFDGDGLRLCSNFRSSNETRYTPVLVLLDESEGTEILSRAFEIGISDYLMAPIDSNELIARVNVQVKRKRYQDALRMHLENNAEMSITDPLTGCYNRRYFDMHFQNIVNESSSKNKNLSIMILDVDHFKQVNDTLGHPVGDELLKQMRKRIFDNVRVSDLLARFGGEEFVVILPDTAIGEASTAAERLRNKISEEPFVTSAGAIEKTVSIGVAEFREGEDAQEFLNRVDKCLYSAKETRNTVVSDQGS